jgi:hypothetical protein
MRTRTFLTLLAVVLAALTALPASAAQAQGWAPASRAKITPGVQMFTKGAQCTANFVYAGSGHVFVGYAAHCAGTGAATDTNGCHTKSLPLGTRVRFARGATVAGGGETVGHGTLVYSSWLAMQRLHTTNRGACAANDLALVRVDAGDVPKVNPSVPLFGGPTGLGDTPRSTDRVYSYGQSSLRPTTALSPKTGVTVDRASAGWGFEVYTATPGIPGDSGSGFLDARGRAIGVLSTVALAPLAGSNGVGSLRKELGFAQAHSGIRHLHVVRGTKDVAPVPVP